VRKFNQRDRTALDIGRVEYGEIAAILGAAPDRGEQPAVAFGRVGRAGDKHRLGGRVAVGKKMRGASSVRVDMGEAVEKAARLAARACAGVPAMPIDETGAAVVDARKLAGQVIEVGSLE